MKFSKIKIQMVKEKSFNYNSRTIKTATDVVKFINEIEQLDKATEENVILICMNTKNQIIAYNHISRGTINTCKIDMKSIYKTILLCNASKFILVHNHPSGNATPSCDDFEVTDKLKESSKVMDIQFIDHIVAGENNFTSCMR